MAGITRVQRAIGADTSGSAVSSVNTGSGGTGHTAFAASVTAGNLLLAVVRSQETNTNPSVTDTLSTSYSSVTSHTSAQPGLWIFVGVAPSTGTCTVTVTLGTSGTYVWLTVIEYAPSTGSSWASPVDVSATPGDGSGTTDLTTGTLTTAQASEVVLAAASQNNAATYTAGTDFTLIDGDLAGGVTIGGTEEYLTSATLSGYTPHITTTNGPSHFGMVAAAFKDTPTVTSGSVIDESGNQNHGVITGAVPISDNVPRIFRAHA
jgi:hypothetical protein